MRLAARVLGMGFAAFTSFAILFYIGLHIGRARGLHHEQWEGVEAVATSIAAMAAIAIPITLGVIARSERTIREERAVIFAAMR